MMDYYLTFPDKKAFEAAMWEPNEEGGYSTEDMAVDVIGVIYRNTGTDEEPMFAASDGFHVNIRSHVELPDDLEAFVISKPNNPKRMFA